MSIYTLRDADTHDLHFLFGVIIAVRQSEEIFDWGVTFRDFKALFFPEKIQIIQHRNRDIGRLRVERPPLVRSIYVGGIQLLPAFQNKGIGSAIFADLIQESEQTKLPICLEVFVQNESAFRFYTRLGFIEEGKSNYVRQLVRVPEV